jgi:glycosyltransferase involved in cell wall biosynthesis
VRICFCNLTAGFKSGGLETYCWEAGHALAGLGHHVTVVGGKGAEGANGGAGPRHADVRLLALPYTSRVRFPNLGSRFRKFMERRSFARHALPELLAGAYNAIVINKPYDFPLLWQARRRGLAAITVLRSGGTDFWPGDRFFAGAVDRWASSSAYNARQVEGRYGRKVEVIHNGVDTDRFVPQPRAPGARTAGGLPEEAVVAVTCGRLVGWKGLSVVIDALPALPESVHYLIIGDGPERPVLEMQAATLGVGGRVHFAGHVAHTNLPGWLTLADLYLQPSIGEEAFGISVVEAMACGLPVLVSDQGGLPEIVADESVGQRLPPGNSDAWRAAIAKFAGEPQLRQTAGIAARQRAVATFTWQANAQKLLRLIAGGMA